MKTLSSPETPNGAIKTLQILNVLGFVLMILMNFLANLLPLNGKTTGEISDNYENLFVPSGATFSIWGVIYLLLFVFTLYQASSFFNKRPSLANTVVRQINIWYLASSIFNTLWIMAWHYELLPVSVAIMWLLLLSLILTHFGLSNINDFLPKRDRLLTKAAFGIYLGWISVATIANMSAWLTGIQWTSGLEEDTWAVLMILTGAVLTFYASVRLSNGFITLSVVWAFIGIVAKRTQSDPIEYSIVYVAGVSAGLLLVSSVLLLMREFKRSSLVESQPSPLYD
jgi:hypothetical protein